MIFVRRAKLLGRDFLDEKREDVVGVGEVALIKVCLANVEHDVVIGQVEIIGMSLLKYWMEAFVEYRLMKIRK